VQDLNIQNFNTTSKFSSSEIFETKLLGNSSKASFAKVMGGGLKDTFASTRVHSKQNTCDQEQIASYMTVGGAGMGNAAYAAPVMSVKPQL